MSSGEVSVIIILPPFTCNLSSGLDVPIPTYPVLLMRIASVTVSALPGAEIENVNIPSCVEEFEKALIAAELFPLLANNTCPQSFKLDLFPSNFITAASSVLSL